MKFQEMMELYYLIRDYRELAIDPSIRLSDRLDYHSDFNERLRRLDNRAFELGITDLRLVEIKEE